MIRDLTEGRGSRGFRMLVGGDGPMADMRRPDI
jgi:hypothetical protein